MKKNTVIIDPTHFLLFINRYRLANYKRRQFLDEAKDLLGEVSEENLKKLCVLLDRHTTTEGADHAVLRNPDFLKFVFAPIK